MKRMMAFNQIKKYLKKNSIQFIEDFENEVPRLTMVFRQNLQNCPDQLLEACIWFFESGMEVRCYYNENAAKFCKESPHKAELYRLMNYINAKVFIQSNDYAGGSLYSPRCLHATRFYVSEDGAYDIMVSTLIEYDWYAICPLETEDFITVSLPVILNKLSIPIFFLLFGKVSVEKAMEMIDRKGESYAI